MSHEQKINYLDIAARIAGLQFEPTTLDLLVSLYEKVTELQGQTTLRDISEVEVAVEKRKAEKEALWIKENVFNQKQPHPAEAYILEKTIIQESQPETKNESE